MAHAERQQRNPGARERLRWSNPVLIPLYVGVVALLALSLGLTADRWQWALRCPFDVEYGEGGILLSAVNIARGTEVYNDYGHYPFAVETYPPAYPLICAIGVRLFGVSFAFGRVLSALATLGIAALIWAMLRRAGIARFAAALAAAIFLATPITGWWGRVMRVDMTAIFLALAGLYCVMRGGRWLIPAVALMALAVYARQTEVVALAAAVLYLWWKRERRNALLVVAAWAVLLLGVSATLQVMTHGWFYRHIIVSNRNQWEWSALAHLWKAVFLDWPAPFVLGLLGAGFALSRRAGQGSAAIAGRNHVLGLFVPYLVLAFAGSLTGGKIGAYINYMIEPLAASCLMAGVAFDRLARNLGSAVGRAAWAAVWLALIVSLVFPIRTALTGGDFGTDWYSRRNIVAGGEKALALIRQTKGDVLSEDVGLPLLAGRRVLLEPFEFTQMFRDGNWDQRPLLADIDRRRFALIVLRWDPIRGAGDASGGTYGNHRWTAGMAGAIMRQYYLVAKAGFLYILAPADAAHPSCAALRRLRITRAAQRSRHQALGGVAPPPRPQ